MSNSPAATRSGEEPLAPMESDMDQEAFAYSTPPVTVGTLSATPDHRKNKGTPELVDSDSPHSANKDLSPPPLSLPSTDPKALEDSSSGPNTTPVGHSLMMEENSHLASHQQHHLHHASRTRQHNSNNFFANLQSESFSGSSTNTGLMSQVHVQHHRPALHKHAENLSSQFSKPQTVSTSPITRRVATDSPSLSPPPPPPQSLQSHLQPPAMQARSSSSNNFFERQLSSGDDTGK